MKKKFIQMLKRFAAKCWEPDNRPYTIWGAVALLWVFIWMDWSGFNIFGPIVHGIGLTTGFALTIYWINRLKGESQLVRRAAYSVAILPTWAFLTFAAYQSAVHFGVSIALTNLISSAGMVLTFVVGLCWFVWHVEMRSRQFASATSGVAGTSVSPDGQASIRIWNPLNLAAWYYHKRREKLDQSAGTFTIYLLAFLAAVALLTGLRGCDAYKLPYGGGEIARKKQEVQVKVVVNKKFVINPYSSIEYNPPPIDKVDLKMKEITKHRYNIGDGEGEEGGFSSGTAGAELGFIRLQYSGGDWDQDGLSPDLNMLAYYHAETGHPIKRAPETKTITQIGEYRKDEPPPFVYMTGQKSISVTDAEVKILREYLIDRHGMIFADNGGSGGWDVQFKGMMNRVLPTIKPVKIPLDHPVHSTPFSLPFLPYVAPHGGKDAIGWVHKGRLVVYYHPGDIGDAWADDHAGVKRQIWQYCYQLGCNIMLYAYRNQNRWREKQRDNE